MTYIGVEFPERTADCDALDEIIKTEDFISIRRQIARLSKLYREVIVRYYLKNQKVKQIAAELGVSENGTLLELAGQCERELTEKFHDIYLDIYQKGRAGTPKHLKNIPEFQRYMFGESFPMLVLLQAKAEHMLFDESGQTPAVIMIIEE